MPEYRNRIGCNVSGTPGTGTITLGAALSGHQAFTTFGANKVVDILIEEGANWEICRDCTFTNNTNTVTRGTLEESSSGSRVSFTSAAKVYLTQTAQRVGYSSSYDDISGLNIARTGINTVFIGSGYVYIRGQRFNRASGGTVTLDGTNVFNASSMVANRLIYIFAYDNAGSLGFQWACSNNTLSPSPLTSDDTFGFYAQEDSTRRCIGYLRTKPAAAELAPTSFIGSTEIRTGRRRTILYDEPYQLLSVTGTVAGSATIDRHTFPNNGSRLLLMLGVGNTTTAGMSTAAFGLNGSINTTTTYHHLVRQYVLADSNVAYSGATPVPVWGNDELFYAVGGSATTIARALVAGFEYEV